MASEGKTVTAIPGPPGSPQTPAHESGARKFWQILTRFDSSKLQPYQALRNSLGVVLPLIVGYAIGMPHGGLAMGIGALNVSFSDGSDAAFRHAVRLAICVAVGDMIGRGFECRRSYWLPMTVVIVLKPDFTSTFTRGVLRIAGTIAGLFLATELFHFLPETTLFLILQILVFTFVLRWLGPANYGIFAISVSALIVLLIAILGVAPGEAIWARGINTVAGGCLTLVAYWIWPTWERAGVSELIAQMLDAYREYFQVLTHAYVTSAGSYGVLAKLQESPDLGREALGGAKGPVQWGSLRGPLERGAGNDRGAHEPVERDAREFAPLPERCHGLGGGVAACAADAAAPGVRSVCGRRGENAGSAWQNLARNECSDKGISGLARRLPEAGAGGRRKRGTVRAGQCGGGSHYE